MSFARRPRPHPTPARAPDRARRSPGVGPSRRGLTPRHVRFGVWRRRSLARLPIGPILLVAAAGLTLASLRAAPSELSLDLATAAPVVVATVDLGSGTTVDPDEIEVRAYPVVAIPPTSARATDEVVGRQVTSPIFVGEPVVGARLAPAGLVGIAAATPPTWSAFALPADANLPDATVGQSVDVYALDAAGDLASAPGARRVAHDALVVAAGDEQVTIAVRAADATGVAAALIGSTVVVAITGPDAPGDGDRDGP